MEVLLYNVTKLFYIPTKRCSETTLVIHGGPRLVVGGPVRLNTPNVPESVPNSK